MRDSFEGCGWFCGLWGWRTFSDAFCVGVVCELDSVFLFVFVFLSFFVGVFWLGFFLNFFFVFFVLLFLK